MLITELQNELFKDREVLIDQMDCKVLLCNEEHVYVLDKARNTPIQLSLEYVAEAANDERVHFYLTSASYDIHQLTKSEKVLATAYDELRRELKCMKGPTASITMGALSNEHRTLIVNDLNQSKYSYKGQIIAREVFNKHGLHHIVIPAKSELSRIKNHIGDFSIKFTKKRKRKGAELPIEIESLVNKVIYTHYLQRNCPSIKASYKELVDQATKLNVFDKIPSYASLRRRIQSMDKGIHILKREGQSAYNEYCRGQGQKITAHRLLERVEMDAMHVCLGVVDAKGNYLGYFTVYFAIDVASRCILGYYIEVKKKLVGESPSGAFASVRHMFKPTIPKGVHYKYPLGGKPKTVVMDHGKAYFNNEMMQFLRSNQIDVQFTGTKRGWGKGIAEAFVKTLRTKLLRQIKGYRDSSRFKKRDNTRPEHENCVKISELKAYIEYFIHIEYHQTPHVALKNMTPKEKWEQLYTNAPPVPASPLVGHDMRKLQVSRDMHSVRGITLKKNTFYSKAAKKMFLECNTVNNSSNSLHVEVFYCDTDAKAISIVHPKTGELITAYNSDPDVQVNMSFTEANAEAEANLERHKLLQEAQQNKPKLSKNKKAKRPYTTPHDKAASSNTSLQAILDQQQAKQSAHEQDFSPMFEDTDDGLDVDEGLL